MAYRRYPRAEPCTRCGQPVTITEMPRKGIRPGRRLTPEPIIAYQHTDRAGEHADEADDRCARDREAG
jgi:hypothetical protein